MPQPDTIVIHQPNASKNIFPLILVVIGGGLIFIDYWATKAGGMVAITAGLLAMFMKTGIELDDKNHVYRHFTSLLQWRWGQWHPLKEINYIAIVRIRLSQLAFRPSEATFRQSDEKQEIAFNVNLIIKDTPNKVLKLFTGNRDKSMALTFELAKKLNLHVYDCSTSNKKWVSSDGSPI